MRVARLCAGLIIALTLVLGGALAAATPAAAASKTLQFGKFFADSPGSDKRSAKSLRAEYIVVRNTSSKSIKLGGYRIKDTKGHTYVFPKSFVLKGKKSVTVHTGKGKNTKTNLYWNRGAYIWNNTKDTATLLGKSGSKKLDTCTYRHNKSGYVNC